MCGVCICVCVCVCVCVYIYIYIYIYTHTRIARGLCKSFLLKMIKNILLVFYIFLLLLAPSTLSARIYLHLPPYQQAFFYIYIYIYICVCMCICICVCIIYILFMLIRCKVPVEVEMMSFGLAVIGQRRWLSLCGCAEVSCSDDVALLYHPF